MAYPLVLLSHTSAGVLERAQQQIEWMSDHVCATFGTKRDNPFELHCVKTMTSLEQLSHLPAGPKVSVEGLVAGSFSGQDDRIKNVP